MARLKDLMYFLYAFGVTILRNLYSWDRAPSLYTRLFGSSYTSKLYAKRTGRQSLRATLGGSVGSCSTLARDDGQYCVFLDAGVFTLRLPALSRRISEDLHSGTMFTFEDWEYT